VFATVPTGAYAQGTQQAAFRISIDGTPAGTATAVTNLPADAVATPPDSSATTTTTTMTAPPAAGGAGSVTIATSDPALVAAFQSWMKPDSSAAGGAAAAQKTVEIDHMMSNGPMKKYKLSGAAPTKVDGIGGSSVITLAYQKIEVAP
jgi:hypothetical protein